jgi:ribonucleoside-diphosphate reductase subunit M2
VQESSNIVTEVKLLEALCFYIFLIAVENIRSKMYSLFMDTYIKDRQVNCTYYISLLKQCHASSAMPTGPSNGVVCGVTPTTPAFAAVKGVFFCVGSFCAIFWLKKHRVMPGLSFSFSNKLISQDEDEGLHCNFACLM